jgi:conjugal transfer ATP-binding protein TraC
MISALRSAMGWFSQGKANFEESGADFVTPRQANDSLPFDRFSSFLPYSGYDEEHRLFVIESDQPGKPEGWGFTLEVQPQIGASQEMANFMVNLFSVGAPTGTGFQVQIYGSPMLENLFDGMMSVTVAPEDSPYPEQATLLRKMSEKRTQYYRSGATKELFENFNYRMRDYRCNLSVVMPNSDISSEAGRREAASLRQGIITTLNQYHLFKYEWTPEHLINYLALILNPHRTMAGDYPWLTYDDGKEIRYQIVAHDTHAQEGENEITYSGAGHPEIAMRAMSVRSYPRAFGMNNIGQLLGSTTSTAIAYPCPFLITMGVTLPSYEAEKNATMMKSARAQQTAESQMAKFLPHLQDVNEDWKIAQRAFDEGKGTCKLYHQLLLFCEPENLQRAEQAAKAVWRSERFELTRDRKMQKQGLLSAMPMMFGPLMQKDLKVAQRMSTKTLFNAANMMPLLGEWTGTPPRQGEDYSQPVLTLFGRKGQAMTIDVFANPSGNYNGIVVGTSGSGKSFFLNELTTRLLATGGRVWIIDVGRSYEKLCSLLGGQFIEFTDNANISLNPFSLVEDIDKDMEMLKPLIAQMISPSRPLTDYELAQIEMHLRSIWYDYNQDATITHLAHSLKNNCSMGGPNPQADDAEWREKVRNMPYEEKQKFCDPRIRDLGVQLFPFTEDGAYGKYFKGRANIDFRSNFIVLELEELKSKKDLQAVVMLMLMYRITQDMYVSERSQPKVVIIDEAWDLMGSGNSGEFIEAGYRRARKYGGGFFTGTQSVADYYKSETAKAAFENADWMFLLRQKPESIEMLANSGKFIMDDYTKTLLRSVTTQSGAFAEVFVRGGDLPPSVGRLFADPFAILTASSKADDFEAVRRFTSQGMSTERAIEAVLEQRAAKRSSSQRATS